MKKLLFIAFALLSFMFVSCDQEYVGPKEQDKPSEEGFVNSDGSIQMSDYTPTMYLDSGQTRIIHFTGNYPNDEIKLEKDDVKIIEILHSDGPGEFEIVETQLRYLRVGNVQQGDVVDCNVKITLKTGEVYKRNMTFRFFNVPEQ